VTCEKYSQTPDNFKVWELDSITLEGSHEWTSTIKDSIRYVKWSSDSKYMARTCSTQSKIIQVFNIIGSFTEPEALIELEKVSYFDFVPRNEENISKPLYFIVVSCGPKETVSRVFQFPKL